MEECAGTFRLPSRLASSIRVTASKKKVCEVDSNSNMWLSLVDLDEDGEKMVTKCIVY